MDKETLRKVQLTQLEILKEVDRVCKENDIDYWLDSGTLLGAVRHKGFIPWDDDLDIAMRREDYERFLRIAPQKMDCNFFVQHWNNDIHYPFPWAKVRKRGTIFTEYQLKDSASLNGIYIDIFPTDRYGNRKIKQGFPLKFIKLAMLTKCHLKAWKEYDRVNYKKLITHAPIRLMAHVIPRQYMINKYYQVATSYNNKDIKQYYGQGIVNYGERIYSEDMVKHLIDLPFEDGMFPCPADYDGYLKISFGDYMTLPPENERENRHRIVEIKL